MVDRMVYPRNKSARKFTCCAFGSLAGFGLICEELHLFVKVCVLLMICFNYEASLSLLG